MPKISLKAYLNKLDDLLKDAHYDEAIHHSRHILSQYPKNVAAFRRMGKAYQSTQRLKEAGQVYRRILSVYPDDVESHAALSHIANVNKKGDEAIWHLERVLERQPNNPELTKQLRALYNQYRGVSNPKFALTARAVAEQQVKAGLFQRALDLLQSAIERSPARIDLKLLLAQTLWEMGLKVEAAEMSIEVLKVLPDCLPANRILTQLWLTEQRPSDAQRYLSRIEAVDPYLAFQLAQGSPPAEDLLQIEELDYRREAQREISTRSPDWLSTLGESVTDDNWADSLIDDDEDSMLLEPLDDDDDDSMQIDTTLGDAAHIETLNLARQRAQEHTEPEDDLSDLFGDTFDEVPASGATGGAASGTTGGAASGTGTGLTGLLGTLEDDADDNAADAEAMDLSDLFGETTGEGTGLTGLLGSLEEDEAEQEEPPTLIKPKRTPPKRESGLTGLLSMLGGEDAVPDEEEVPAGEEDPLAWMKDSGLHDAVTKATAPLEASEVDSLFEEMAAKLNAETGPAREGSAPPEAAAPVDANDPLAWLKSSGIEINEEEEPADLFADAFEDEEMDAQLAQAAADDPLAWLKSSGIEIEEDSSTIDLFGDDFDEADVKGAETADDPMSWLKSSGLMVDDDEQTSGGAAGDSGTDGLDWMQDDDQGDDEEAPSSAYATETLTGTEADDEIDLFRDDDDVLAEMLFMEDLAFSSDDGDGGDESDDDSSADTLNASGFDELEDDLQDEDEQGFDEEVFEFVDLTEGTEDEDDDASTMPDMAWGVSDAETPYELDDQDAESMADQNDENLPDWLSASDDASGDEEQGGIEWLDIGEDDGSLEDDEDALDWMAEPQANASEDASGDGVFDLFGDLDSESMSDEDAEDDNGDLPAWAIAAAAGAGAAGAGLFDDDGEDTTDEEEAAPGWLSEIGGDDTMSNLFDDESDDAEESGGVPDWLSDIGGDEFEDEEDEGELEAGEMPDWLSQAAPVETDEDEESTDEADELAFLFSGGDEDEDDDEEFAFELDDADESDAEEADELAFLFGGDEEEADDAELSDEEEGAPDWLSAIRDDASEDESDEEFAFELDDAEESDAEEADELAFLFGGGDDADSSEDEEDDAELSDEEEGAPDWLSAISDDASEDESDEEFAFELDDADESDAEEADELAFLFGGDDADSSEDEEDELEEGAPDWLSAISDDASEDESDEEFAFELDEDTEDEDEYVLNFIEGDEDEDTLIGEAPMGASFDFGGDEDESYDEDEEAELADDVPEWLAGAYDDEDLSDEADLSDEDFIEDEDDQPDWLKAAGIGAAAASAAGALAADDDDEEDVPDWLAAVGDDADLSDEEEEYEEDYDEIDDEFDMSPDETPSWLASAESPGTAAADDFDDEDQPDWLSALGEDEEETADDFEEEEDYAEASNIPDWLSAASPEDYADEDEEEGISLFEDIEEDADLIDYDETMGEEIEPTPASNAPDWLNAMVPGLDVDYQAQVEDEPLETEFLEDAALRAEYGWLTDIVNEELRPPASLPPAPAASEQAAPERSRFSFSKRPSWLPKLSQRPAWMRRAEKPQSAPQSAPPPADDELSDDELPPWLQIDDDER